MKPCLVCLEVVIYAVDLLTHYRMIEWSTLVYEMKGGLFGITDRFQTPPASN